jgi:hypothetical protein
MTAELLRDAAATAAVFGFFASAWFGWAQDQPPPAWRTALDADTSRTFGLVVGIEVALAAIGAAVLARRRRSELIPLGGGERRHRARRRDRAPRGGAVVAGRRPPPAVTSGGRGA